MVEESLIRTAISELIAAYTSHQGEINSAIYPEKEALEGKSEITPIYLNRFGGSASNFLRLEVVPAVGEARRFMARYYSGVPDTYKGKYPPWEVGAATYKFLREEAGIQSVPRSYHPETAKLIFFEWLSGNTHQQVVNNEKSLKDKEKRIIRIFEPLSDFHCKATAAARNLTPERKSELFAGRNFDEKAREYIRATTGKVSNAEVAAYVYLLGRANEGDFVLHGDLGPANIMISDDKKICFVDPELSFGDPTAELGGLLAYHTTDFQIQDDMKHRLGTGFKESHLESIIRFSGADLARVTLDAKGEQQTMFRLYGGFIHKAWKILAKNTRTHIYGRDSEERLRSEINHCLAELIHNPKKFGLTSDDVSAASVLSGVTRRIKRDNVKDSDEVIGKTAVGISLALLLYGIFRGGKK